MEIDQLTVTPISLTFRMKTFLHESDDLVPLDTPIIVLLDKRHRDGETLFRAILTAIQVILRYGVLVLWRSEINLDFHEVYTFDIPSISFKESYRVTFCLG